MRAVVITGPGAAPECAEFAEPVLEPGAEQLELVGAGLHTVVRSLAAGRHYGSTAEYPLVPGADAVARAADGRLLYTGGTRPPWGTMAERLTARLRLEVPAGADPLAVAAGMNPAMAGWLPLSARAEHGGLGTVLVLGATGIAGSLAVQSAFILGADRVVATGRDPERLQRASGFGAITVQLDGAGGASRLGVALAGDPPSLVLDFVWGPVAETAFAVLARRGLEDDTADITYTQIGAMAGPDARVPAELLRSRRIRIVGSGAGSTSSDRILAELPRLLQLIADGRLAVPYTAFPMARVADAWAHRGPSRAVIVP